MEVRKFDPSFIEALIGASPAIAQTAAGLAGAAGLPGFYEAIRRKFPVRGWPRGIKDPTTGDPIKHTPEWFEEMDMRREHRRMVNENPDKYRWNSETGRAEALGAWSSEQAGLARDEQKEQQQEEETTAHEEQLGSQDMAFLQRIRESAKERLGHAIANPELTTGSAWAYGAPVAVLHAAFQPKDAMEALLGEKRGRASAERQHGDDWQWMAGSQVGVLPSTDMNLEEALNVFSNSDETQ